MDTVFDLDDLCDEFDPWDELCALKERIPGLKVTLFAIPSRCSDELLARYRALDWVELGVHGYHHSSYECGVWGYEETVEKLNELQELGWQKLFKAPGWIANYKVYDALLDCGWSVADNIEKYEMWGDSNPPRYVYNANREVKAIHGHTWDCMGNGPSNWEEMFADVCGEFKFVSEVCGESPSRTYLWAVLDEMNLQPGDLFVDCGAFKGEEIEVLAPMGVRVMSFEAHPELADDLVRRWDGHENVEIVPKAVDDHEYTAKFSESVGYDTGSSLLAKKDGVAGGRTFDVEVVRLADVLRGEQVKVLKLDVEGAEWRILDDLLDDGLLGDIEHIYLEDHANRIGDAKLHETRERVLLRCKGEGIELKRWV